MIVLASIPKTTQLNFNKQNLPFFEMDLVNKNMKIFDKQFSLLERENMFVVCDNTHSTYGYITMNNLNKYPESYLTMMCKFELKQNNRIIVLDCNEAAIYAVVEFYETGKWNRLHVENMMFDNVITEQYSQCKYNTEFIFDFLQLPSCNNQEEVIRYYKALASKECKRKHKNNSTGSMEDYFANQYMSNVPEEFIDDIDYDDLDAYVEEKMEELKYESDSYEDEEEEDNEIYGYSDDERYEDCDDERYQSCDDDY